MKLLPDIEFDEDIRLLIYRPHGVIDEAAVKKVVSVLEDLEAKLQQPVKNTVTGHGKIQDLVPRIAHLQAGDSSGAR